MRIVLITTIISLFFSLKLSSQTYDSRITGNGKDVWNSSIGKNRYVRVTTSYSYCGTSNCPYEKSKHLNMNSTNISENKWYRINGTSEPNVYTRVTIRKEGMACPSVRGSFSATYTSSDYGPGRNTKQIRCNVGNSDDVLGTVSIYELPIMTASSFYAQVYNHFENKLVTTNNVVEGDTVYIHLNGGIEGSAAVFLKENSNYIEKYPVSGALGFKIGNIVPSGNYSKTLTYYIKSKQNGYYSANHGVLNLNVYKKPELTVNSVFYACKNATAQSATYKIKQAGTSGVKLVLFYKDNGNWIPKAMKIKTSFSTSSNYPLTELNGNVGLAPGDYYIQIENRYGSTDNDQSNIGYSRHFFSVKALPAFNLAANNDVTVTCPTSAKSITINSHLSGSFPTGTNTSNIQYKLGNSNWSATNTYSVSNLGNYNIYIRYNINGGMCQANDAIMVSSTYSNNVTITAINSNNDNICDGTNVNLSLTTDYDTNHEGDLKLQYKKSTESTWKSINRGQTLKVAEGKYDARGYYTTSKFCMASPLTNQNCNNTYTPISISSGPTSGNISYCSENGNGQIGVGISGGNPNFTYKVYNDSDQLINGSSQTTSTRSYNYNSINSENNYYIKITDGKGCSKNSSQKEININNEFKLAATPTEKTDINYCAENSDGTFTINFTGGNGTTNYTPILYRNNTIYTTSNITKNVNNCAFSRLPPGEYYATIKMDGINCEVNAEGYKKTISINTTNEFKITSFNTENIEGCEENKNGSFTVNVSGGTSPYTYKLYKEGIATASETASAGTSHTFVVEEKGNYKVTVSCSECNEIETNSTFENLNSIENPVDFSNIVFNSSLNTCNGHSNGSIELNLVNTTGSLQVNLSGTSTGQLNANPTGAFTGLSAGNYTISVTDKNCIHSVSNDITEPAKLTFTHNTQDVTCNNNNDGEIHFLSVKKGAAVINRSACWFTADGTNWSKTYDYSLLANNNYSLAVSTDATGSCKSDPIPVTIGEPNPITVNFEKSDFNGYAIRCNGGTGSLLWNNVQGGNIGNFTINREGTSTTYNATESEWPNIGEGTYKFWVSDSKGCTSNQETIVFNEPNQLSHASISSTSPNCAANFDGDISFTVNGEMEPYAITYDNQDDISVNGTLNFNNSNITISNLNAGDYTISISDKNNCILNTSKKVTALSSPAVDLTPTHINCKNDQTGSILVNATFESKNNFSYSINNGSFIDADTDHIFSSLQAGIYSIKVQETGRNCVTEKSITLTEPSNVLAHAGFSFQNASTQLTSDGFIKITPTGGTAPYSIVLSGTASATKNNAAENIEQTFENLPSGDFTILITDSKGCTKEYNQTISKPATPLSVIVEPSSSSHVMCKNEPTGIISLAASGGWSNYKFSITGPNTNISNATNTTFSGLKAGTYSIEVTDDLGATQSINYEITEPAFALSGTVNNITHVDCKNNATGSFELTITGGAESGYEYDFNNQGRTSYTAVQSFNTLEDGIYTYKIYDANNCSFEGLIELTEPTAPLQAATSMNNYNSLNIKCKNETDTIEVWSNGGTPPYLFKLNNIEKNTSAENETTNFNSLIAGTYSIYFEDANKCNETIEVTLTEADSELLINTKNFTEPTCFNQQNATLSLTGTGGVSTLNYQFNIIGKEALNKSVDKTLSGSNVNFDNLYFGKYYINITDANNCAYLDSIAITQPDPLDFTITQTQNINCFDEPTGEIKLQISGGRSPYKYCLNGTDTLGTSTSLVLTGLKAKIHQIEVFDASNCSIIKTLELTQQDKLETTLSFNNYNDSTIRCFGLTDTVFISSNGGFGQYTLLFGSEQGFFESDTLIPMLAAGNYQITVTDELLCSNVIDFHLSHPNKIEIDEIFTTNVKCSGTNTGTATINLKGGIQSKTFTYNFTGINGTIYSNSQTDNFNTICNNLPSGSFRIVTIDNNNCTDTSEFALNEPDPLSIELTTQPVKCKGTNTGSIASTINGGTSPYEFYWINSTNDTLSNNQNLTNKIAGDYSLIVKDANQCLNESGMSFPTATHTIDEPNQPLSLSITNFTNPLCSGNDNGTINAIANGGWNNFTYKLNDIIYLNAPNYQNLGAGNYEIVVLDSMMCPDTVNLALTDNDPIEILSLITDSVSCFGESNGEIEVIPAGGNGVYEYSIDNESWQTNRIFIGLSAKNHLVYLRDSNKCWATQDVAIGEPEEILLNQIRIKSSIACQPTGEIEVAAHGGYAPYQYQWDENTGNQTGAIASNLAAGIYKITITDSKYCNKAITTGPVNQINGPVVSSIKKHNTTCETTADGSLEIDVDYSSDVTITWLIPEEQGGNIIGNKAENLFPGIYTAEILTDETCYSYFIDTIKAPEALSVSFISENILCKGTETGKIEASIEGGIPPYEFIWEDQNGIIANNILSMENLGANEYSLKISDQSTCSKTDGYHFAKNVTLTEPSTSIEISQVALQNNRCYQSNNAYIKLKAAGGQGNWQFANSSMTFDTESLFENLNAGNHWFYTKDDNNCMDSIQLTITEPELLACTFENINDVTCYNLQNGEAIISGTGGTAPYEYKLETDENYTSSNQFINLFSNSYKGIVKDALNCTDTFNFNISQPLPLSIQDELIKDSWCSKPNGKIQISILGGTKPYHVNWNDENSQVGFSANNLMNGSYSAKVTDANNCSSSKEYTLSNHEEPRLFIEEIKPATCSYLNNGKINLSMISGTAPFTFNWYGAQNTDSLSSDRLGSGKYIVQVTDALNCIANIGFTIEAPEKLYFNDTVIEQPLCFNDSTGNIQVYATGGTPGYNYSWSNKVETSLINNLTAGKYTVTVTDLQNCQYTETYQLFYPEELTIAQINKKDTWCSEPNGFIKIEPNGGTGAYTYQWINLSNQTSDSIGNLAAGEYSVLVTDENNCSLETTIKLEDIKAPVLSVETITNAKCSYSSDGAIKLNVNYGKLPFEFNWDNSSTSLVASHSGYKKGNYFVTVEDDNNCTDTLHFNIGAPDSLYVLLHNIIDPTCYNFNNGTIALETFGGTPPYTHQWNNGQTTNVVNNLSAGEYTVKVIDKNNCIYGADYYLLNPDPVIVELENEANICSNQIYYANAGTGGEDFYWYSSNGFESTDRIAEIYETGTYTVEVLNYNNCLGTDSITVNVSKEVIESSFLLRSETYVGDTLVMIEISWPIPESIEWDIPSEFDIVYEGSYEVEFIATQEGTYNIGLTTYNDICTEVTAKQLLVRSAEEKPEGYAKSGEANILNKVSVHPVPTSGPFNLEILLNKPNDVIIEIMHMSGTTQFKQKMSGNKKYVLNFSNVNLADGIHTIRVMAGNEVKVKKLIITK